MEQEVNLSEFLKELKTKREHEKDIIFVSGCLYVIAVLSSLGANDQVHQIKEWAKLLDEKKYKSKMLSLNQIKLLYHNKNLSL